MSPSSTEFKTANLTLASYLSHLDWGYSLVRGEGQSATWVFKGEHVKAHAEAFTSSKAKVEPQSFHHSITRTRKLLFKFLAPECTDKEWTEDQVKEKLG